MCGGGGGGGVQSIYFVNQSTPCAPVHINIGVKCLRQEISMS